MVKEILICVGIAFLMLSLVVGGIAVVLLILWLSALNPFLCKVVIAGIVIAILTFVVYGLRNY